MKVDNKKKDILDFLKEEGVINDEQIKQIRQFAQNDNSKIEKMLVDQKIVDAEKLTEIKAKSAGLKYASLLEEKIPKEILNIISEDAANNYKVVCFHKEGNRIDVGILDYRNLKAMEAINFLAAEEGYKISYYLISDESFKRAMKQYQSLSEEVDVALKARAAEDSKKTKKEKVEQTDEIVKAAPISKIVSVILKHAVEGGASDIHIESYKNESRIRYRIDGILHTSLVLPFSVHNSVVARIKVLASLKLDETRIPQDGRIRIAFDAKKIDFRVSILPLVEAEKVVMRILDVSRGAPTLKDLGFEGRSLNIINKSIEKTDGMFLVTGPTGSGKSTTLFSSLHIVNQEGVNISTLEDPVEYFLDGANQAQIRNEVGFTFAAGLRSLLRQDPDIIMVGEIRDNETAQLAIHAALTGHLVLSTLHTNDSLGAIPRLIDMEVEPFLLASTLNGILAQRLVRRICPHCKEEQDASDEVKNDIEKEIKKIYDFTGEEVKKLLDDTVLSDDHKKIKLYIGKGCSRCGGTGYKGRISIAEVLDIDDEIKSMIANKKELNYQSEVIKKQQFITVKQDGIIRALQGITSMEEVLRVMSD